jgi:hypothetical protein
MNKILFPLFASFLFLACTPKPEAPKVTDAKPSAPVCTEEKTPHYPDPKSAADGWATALIKNDFCAYILSYAPNDRAVVTKQSLALIGQSANGPQGQEAMKKIFAFMASHGVGKDSKQDQNQLIDEASKKPDFFVGLMTALDFKGPVVPPPKFGKLQIKDATAKGELTWQKPHQPLTEEVRFVKVNDNWFVHEWRGL